MLHDGDHPRSHEPGSTYRRARPGDLGNLDCAPHLGYLDPSASPAGVNLEALSYRSADVHQHFDPVTLHSQKATETRPKAPLPERLEARAG